MKSKLTVFLAGMFLLVGAVGSANALPWSWDLTGTGYTATGTSVTGYTGTTVNFINDLGAVSATETTSTIAQALTGGLDDTVLDNGDTFSEFGFLSVLDADNTGLLFSTGGGPANAYIAFEGLTGYVYNYNNGGDGDTTLANYTDKVANDSFNLAFNPGIGSISIYLDDNIDPTDGALQVATFSLLAASGSSPSFAFAGAAEGQFGMVAGFQSVLDGFWSFSDGTDFDDWLTMYGPNSIVMSSFNLGATFQDVSDDGTNLLFSVLNEGSFQMSAIPEPTTLLLLGFGLIGLAGVSRKKA